LHSIDLSANPTSEVAIENVLESFVSGRGVKTRLAPERILFDADSLGVDNRLYFMTGPILIPKISFTGRMNARVVSPPIDRLLS
jgi:aldehyde:ferredoxin oxidoreductase